MYVLCVIGGHKALSHFPHQQKQHLPSLDGINSQINLDYNKKKQLSGPSFPQKLEQTMQHSTSQFYIDVRTLSMNSYYHTIYKNQYVIFIKSSLYTHNYTVCYQYSSQYYIVV